MARMLDLGWDTEPLNYTYIILDLFISVWRALFFGVRVIVCGGGKDNQLAST